MAHEGVKHDYHLVNPSIWPLVGSMSFALAARAQQASMAARSATRSPANNRG